MPSNVLSAPAVSLPDAKGPVALQDKRTPIAPLVDALGKALTRAHKRDIVNRSMMIRVFAAWVITVPATAVLSALVFFTLRGMLIP